MLQLRHLRIGCKAQLLDILGDWLNTAPITLYDHDVR